MFDLIALLVPEKEKGGWEGGGAKEDRQTNKTPAISFQLHANSTSFLMILLGCLLYSIW